MELYLTKTDFIWKYLVCPSYLWLAKYKPELVQEKSLERRFASGNLVEQYARELFPEGVLVESHGPAAAAETKRLIDGGATTLFQATAHTDSGMLARADVITLNPGDNTWTIHEVKDSVSVKTEHTQDLAFQKSAFEGARYAIGKLEHIHINNQYVRQGDIDPEQLFLRDDVTKQVAEVFEDTNREIKKALHYLFNAPEPKTCECILRRSNHCPTFRYFHPNVPEYSIFEISGLGQRILEDLIDQDIYAIEAVPDGIKLTEKQRNQVVVAKTGKPLIKPAVIKDRLDGLKYPLYFFDYETTTGGIPLSDGWRPYQGIPFQYSLHVVGAPGAKATHHEFLADSSSVAPAADLLVQLKQDLPDDDGTVIGWSKSFEIGCNNAMAKVYPEYRDHLEGINGRMFDQMDVFRTHAYVHAGFRGKYSLKDVLPVLVPELSHKNLVVQEGTEASALWNDTRNPEMPETERAKIRHELLEYCKLDTLAMVRIHEHLLEVCGP